LGTSLKVIAVAAYDALTCLSSNDWQPDGPDCCKESL